MTSLYQVVIPYSDWQGIISWKNGGAGNDTWDYIRGGTELSLGGNDMRLYGWGEENIWIGIDRGIFIFDTSSIPVGSNIISVIFSSTWYTYHPTIGLGSSVIIPAPNIAFYAISNQDAISARAEAEIEAIWDKAEAEITAIEAKARAEIAAIEAKAEARVDGKEVKK